MPDIHLLTSEISDLIAAGEVIERPASVVKELVENSIDAGSKQILVEIIGGGLKKIKVSDDGSGMSSSNAEKCFLKHATSKILNKEDLFSIRTLGFRGEALPSIAAVSKVKLVTKEGHSILGFEVINEAGAIKHKGEIGAADGTTFEVTDLFYNTPARLKFMKSEQAETGVIHSLIEKLALSHPDISFKFSSNGNMKLLTPGNGKISDTIYAIYGRDFSSRLLQVNYSVDNIRIKGYTGKPLLNKPSRNFQIFFVNGRLVKSRVLQQALEQSYRNAMLVGRYPCCIIFLNIPFAEVDINVHPSKTEIKFSDDTYISNHVNKAISIALREDIGIFQVEEKNKESGSFNNDENSVKRAETIVISEENMSQIDKKAVEGQQESLEETISRLSGKPLTQKADSNTGTAKKKNEYSFNFGSWQIINPKETSNELSITTDDNKTTNGIISFCSENVELTDSNMKLQPETEIAELNKTEEDKHSDILMAESMSKVEKTEDIIQTEILPIAEDYRIVGEIFKTYILIEKNKELQLIDKHALHERMIFEQLKIESGVTSQILLTPYVCNLGSSENEIIDSNKKDLNKLGFDIDTLGTALIIREIPDIINIEDIEYILYKAVEFIKTKGKITEEVFDELLYVVACKAATKSGYNTTYAEIEALIKEYMKNKETLRYCPHGRPIVVSFTQTFIEKQFKRIV